MSDTPSPVSGVQELAHVWAINFEVSGACYVMAVYWHPARLAYYLARAEGADWPEPFLVARQNLADFEGPFTTEEAVTTVLGTTWADGAGSAFEEAKRRMADAIQDHARTRAEEAGA